MAEIKYRYSEQQITDEDVEAVVRTLRSPYLTQGPEVERFEAALCEFTGARYAVAVSSGTAALHLAYLAAGVGGSGDTCQECGHGQMNNRYIVTSPLSFVATANAAVLAGGDVAFSDVNPSSGLVSVQDLLEGMSRVDLGCDLYASSIAVPVHYAGIPADLQGLPADRTIEDACHALGARDFDGCSMVGACAHSLATVFSFHPVKTITAGEGGAVTTNNEGFAQEIRTLRSHGRDFDGLMRSLGLNYRMTDLQAALGASQLKRCREMVARRSELALAYFERLSFFEALVEAKPGSWTFNSSGGAWHLRPIWIPASHRDEFRRHLLEKGGIDTRVHYDPIIPLQPYYRARFGFREGQFPNAERWAREEVSLPMHPGLTTADVNSICDTVLRALDSLNRNPPESASPIS